MHNFLKSNFKVTLWCSTNMIVLSKQAEKSSLLNYKSFFYVFHTMAYMPFPSYTCIPIHPNHELY